MEQEFNDEIERIKNSNGGLNNFHGNLPGGYRVERESSSPRLLEERLWADDEMFSDLLRSKTVGQFSEDCRLAVLAVGMREDEPYGIWLKCSAGDISEKEYIDLMAPVYIHLRRMGYGRYDLTA